MVSRGENYGAFVLLLFAPFEGAQTKPPVVRVVVDFGIMEGKMADEDKEKGFSVRDKRHFAGGKVEERQEGEEQKGHGATSEARQPQEGEKEEPERQEEAPLPEINFSNFVFSLSTSVLIQLGEMPDPISTESGKNLSMAKQTIDILGMLQEKTKGNLTPDEESLIKNILYDLRMRFVKAKE